MPETVNMPIPGAQAPNFKLSATDGSEHSLADYDDQIVVYIQASNTCPVVAAYLGRIKELSATLSDRAVQFLLVNSNDSGEDGSESLDAMTTFARENEFPFPYLHDATQDVARSFGAVSTPETFVLDRHQVLAYHGRIDDNREAEKVTSRDLENALSELIADKRVSVPSTPFIGCSVRWKT